LRKARSILIVLLVGVTATVVGVSLLLTLFLPTLLHRFACEPYGIRCAVGQAKIRPHLNLTTSLVIQNVTVFEHNGSEVLLRARRLAVTIDLLGLIRGRGVMPTEVQTDSPELLLRRLDDGRWNAMVLAEVVRQHMRPTPRVTPIQLPRIVLTAGDLRFGARRVTNLTLDLEPKPAPLLFEVRALAGVEGQTLEASAVVSEPFEGELRVKGRDIVIRGATRPWTPRAVVRFRLDLPARTFNISEWTLEDDGAIARGKAAIRYAEAPPVYVLTVSAWQADLAALAGRLPFSQLSDLKGQVEGEPITLQGHWPKLPTMSVTATLKEIGFKLPKQKSELAAVRGLCRVQHRGDRLRLEVELRGDAVELLGQRHANPVLKAAVGGDPRSGDLVLEELRASFPGMRILAKGSATRWGNEGLDLKTTELTVDHAILNRFLHRADGGVAVKAIARPSIHFRWLGGGRPWNVEIAARSIELASPTSGHAAKLEDTGVTVQGGGASRDDLQGAIVIRRAELSGRPLTNLKAKFEIGPVRIRMSEVGFVAGGGTVQGQASFSRPSPLSDLHATLSMQDLRVKQLFPVIAMPADVLGLALDANISVDVSHGKALATIDLPPMFTRQLSRLLHPIDQATPPATADSHHLTLRAQGILGTGKGMEALGSVTVQGLRALLAGGNAIDRDRPVTLSVAYRDGRATLKTEELGFTAHELSSVLSRFAGGRILGREGSVTLSADTTFGGSRAPSGTGKIVLRGLSLDLARKDAPPARLLRRLQGSLAFSLDKGLLAFKETILRADGGLTLTLKGSLPIVSNAASDDPFRLTLPWTDASHLLSPWAASTPGEPTDARITGQIRANLEISGREIHGAVVLKNVSLVSNLLHLDGVSGTIPLAGSTGQVSDLDQPSMPEEIGWKDVSEKTYEKTLEKRRKSPDPDKDRHPLTIAVLRYGAIELRNLEATLAPSGDHIAIQRLGFEAWGGRVSGSGAVQPLAGKVTIALLTEGLSLRAICDAFPPVKGYISGRLNGLADLSISHFSLDQAQGRARFWAVDSRQERNEISRILIEKLAGQRIRYFNLFGQDRRYDRGVLDVVLKRGDLIFRELDISHSTLGIKDLDIKVAPNFNKIGLAHLLESVREATGRIAAGAKSNP